MAVILVIAFLIALITAVASRGRADSKGTGQPAVLARSDPGEVNLNPSADYWHKRFKKMRLYALKLEHHVGRVSTILKHRASVTEAINLACASYGHCAELWRKARCESRFDPRAANPSGSKGLFQFLDSTWASTPYGRMSVWSPYANALAAGWMHAHGRGGEWSCR